MEISAYPMLMISLVIISHQFNNVLPGDPCPSKVDVWPCTCAQVPVISANTLSIVETENTTISAIVSDTETTNGTSYYTIVTCKNVSSLSALEAAVTNSLHRKSIDKLVIQNAPTQLGHKLAQLPARWLRNTRITQFEIQDSILAGNFISDGNPFEGQSSNLLWFSARNCHLSGRLTYDYLGSTHTQELESLSEIEGIDFSRNFLVYISKEAFRYPPANLSHVNLSYNNIQELEQNSFAYILKLRQIDLSHNVLASPIYRGIFTSPAYTLRHINLSWNSLTSLPIDFFEEMPALTTVDLRSNFLTAIPEEPWATVWRQLTLVQVSGNFLKCDCDILWLLELQKQQKTSLLPSAYYRSVPSVLGSCGHTEPSHFRTQYNLTQLTRENINCSY